ncbi:50S ribosomal protein L11 methyltransferase [Taklimakanibacter deserti]|uniref:50S ribosomal protein L11 methyltransferase n=1 Tax=Taklimakanibacter deserti TaxID=2267839 RepID=UPI000E65881A
MQCTLTVEGLTEARANELALLVENQPEPPLAVTINETDESGRIWNLVAYFAGEAEARGAGEQLRPLLGPQAFAVTALPDVDWVRRSLEGLGPVAAGRFYLYGSHDRARRRSGGISLEIDAGTAFGTGHHATTSGCLLAFDSLLKRTAPRRVLDLGCGTGVLALAAAKALCRPVLASDIDPIAVTVTRDNARNNGASAFVGAVLAPGLKHRRIADRAPYDLIFANILARPLIALAGDLALSLAPGGTLILSGLTRDQEQGVRAAYRNRGLLPASPLRIGNWSTLVFFKINKAKRPRPFRRGRFSGITAGGGREAA